MKKIIVTVIRSKGKPPLRMMGHFPSTTEAIIHTLQVLGGVGFHSISAKPGAA